MIGYCICRSMPGHPAPINIKDVYCDQHVPDNCRLERFLNKRAASF